MIRIQQVPPGTATGATYLVECEESLCRPYCVNASIQPSGEVSFKYGSITVNDGIAIVPVTATVTVTSPSSTGCGCAHTQLFTETFDLPLTATTDNNIVLTPSGSVSVVGTNVRCNKARSVRLTTILEVAIS